MFIYVMGKARLEENERLPVIKNNRGCRLTCKFLHSLETRSITLECCRRKLAIANKSYCIRLASKSAKLVNARTVRCFSAFAPTRI